MKSNPVLLKKVRALLELIEINPFSMPPSYEKLINVSNTYSRRINVQHRLIYQVYEKEKTIKVIRMWTHYE